MSDEIHTTALSIDECLRTLAKHTCSWTDMIRSGFSPPEKGTVIAKIRGNRFRLFAQGSRYVNNSFAPFFYGRLEADTSGTRIVGQFKMHPFVRIFMIAWFGGLAAGSLGLLVASIAGKVEPQAPLILVVGAPLAMFLFGFGLVRFGRWLARGQRQRLEDFIKHDMGARRQETGSLDTASHGTALPRRP